MIISSYINQLNNLFDTLLPNKLTNEYRKLSVIEETFNEGNVLSDDYSTYPYSYVNLHTKGKYSYICIDYDHNDINLILDQVNFPQPNIIIRSNKSSNFHLIYILESPVYRYGKSLPLSLYEDIRKKLALLLRGDLSYNNRYIYNPYNTTAYNTNILHTNRYSLGDFLMYFDTDTNLSIQSKHQLHSDIDDYPIFPVGMRNSLVFEKMRSFGYSNYITAYKDNVNLFNLICDYGVIVNEQYCEYPLNYSEIRSIAKSINYFIHKHFSESSYNNWVSENYNSEKQSYRGSLKNISARTLGISYILNELTNDNIVIAKDIQYRFNISNKTAYNWIKKANLFLTQLNSNEENATLEFKNVISSLNIKQQESTNMTRNLPITSCFQCTNYTKLIDQSFECQHPDLPKRLPLALSGEIQEWCPLTINDGSEMPDLKIISSNVLFERFGRILDIDPLSITIKHLKDMLSAYECVSKSLIDDKLELIVSIPEKHRLYYPPEVKYLKYCMESDHLDFNTIQHVNKVQELDVVIKFI